MDARLGPPSVSAPCTVKGCSSCRTPGTSARRGCWPRSVSRRSRPRARGHAASPRASADQQVTRDELVAHVDGPRRRGRRAAERGRRAVLRRRPRPASPRPCDLLAEAGAAGLSIEDYDPATGADRRPMRGGHRAGGGRGRRRRARHGMVLTARAENHLYGIDDLADTIEPPPARTGTRAPTCVYAPGPGRTSAEIARLVEARRRLRVNVLAVAGGPAVAGARRSSVSGGSPPVAHWPGRPTAP